MPPRTFTDKEAVNAFYTDAPIRQVATDLKADYTTIRDFWIREFGDEAYRERKRRLKSRATSGENHWHYGMRGRESPLYNPDSRYLSTQGYWVVKAPEWWTGNTDDSNRVLEHRVVCAEKLGLTEIWENYEVHHIDEDKTNNDPDNLYMIHKFEHARLHVEGRLAEKVQRLSQVGVGPSGPKRPSPEASG